MKRSRRKHAPAAVIAPASKIGQCRGKDARSGVLAAEAYPATVTPPTAFPPAIALSAQTESGAITLIHIYVFSSLDHKNCGFIPVMARSVANEAGGGSIRRNVFPQWKILVIAPVATNK